MEEPPTNIELERSLSRTDCSCRSDMICDARRLAAEIGTGGGTFAACFGLLVRDGLLASTRLTGVVASRSGTTSGFVAAFAARRRWFR